MDGIKKVFKSDGFKTSAESIFYEQWIDALEQKEKTEMEAAQKLVDYYNRDRQAILEHCKSTAKSIFDSTDVEAFHFPPLNFVPRTINRLALTFKYQPNFIIKNKANDEKVDDKTADKIKYMFRQVDVLKKLKEMDRHSTRDNTILVEVVWRNGAVDWDIHLRSKSIVIPDMIDYLNYSKVAYEFNPMDPETLTPHNGWIYWSKESHEFIDSTTGERYGIYSENGQNPFNGIIPVIVIRQMEQDEFWGTFGSDLVNSNEMAMIQLANIWRTMYLQTFGIPVGTNLGTKEGETEKIGPASGFFAEDVAKDLFPPKLEFAKPDADIQEVMDAIDRYVSLIDQTYGLPPSDTSLDEKRKSGYAKWMDNLELLENREDNISKWEKTIRELFEISVMVHNTFEPERKWRVPDGLYWDVEFPAATYPETPTEKTERWSLAISSGLSNPVDYFIEEKNMNEDEAVEAAKRNAEFNKMFSGFSVESAMRNEPGPDERE